MSTSLGATLRGLRYRRGQTVVALLVIAVLAAIAASAPWYAQMTRDQTTARAFELGAPGSTVRIDSAVGPVPDALVPDDPLLVDPVPSRDAAINWFSADVGEPGEGLLLSRTNVCDQLRFVDGGCPEDADGIAVSTADREQWGFDVGDSIDFTAEFGAEGAFEVVGVYEVADGTDPYWYGLVPDGRSGYRDLEIPVADKFIVDPATWQRYEDIGAQSHLDLRVDNDLIDSDDLPRLLSIYRDLEATVEKGDGLGVSSAVPATIEELEHGFDVAGRGIALTVGQLAAVGMVSLVLTALLGVRALRRDLALRRLRGNSPGRLARNAAVEWLAVAIPGMVLGLLGAGLFAVVVGATWLDEARVLSPPWTAWAAAVAVPVVGSLLIAFLTHRTARAPIPSLLRATEARSATGPVGLLVLDALLLAVVGCSVLVALTSGESSPIVVLAPALLAVGGGVLVCRLLVLLIGRWGSRWLTRRPTLGMAWIEIGRGGGLRGTVVVSAVATALLILTTQAALIGDHNRDRRADIETGAPSVYSTTADVVRVQRALDQVDPERAKATTAVSVGRSADSYRVLYVEPDSFQRIAFGATDAADSKQWSAITVPPGAATKLSGDRLRIRLNGQLITDNPLRVWATVLDADGVAQPSIIGQIDPGAEGSQTVQKSVDCTEECRLLSIELVPEGDLSFRGSIAVEASIDGRWNPIDLDPNAWRATGLDNDGYRLDVTDGAEGALELDLVTGGLPLSLQSTYLTPSLPVLVSERLEVGIEDGRDVRTPGADLLPVEVRGRLHDAVPRLLDNAVLADLSAATRYGDARTSPDAEVTIWFAEDADRVRDALDENLQLIKVSDAARARSVYADSSEALASRLNSVAAVLVALLAAAALGLTFAGGWRRRRDDARSLDLAGVPKRVWKRALAFAYLAPVFIGVAIGAVAGIVGTSIAVHRVPIFATAEPAIALQVDLQRAAVLGAVGAALVVLLLVAALAARATVGSRKDGR